MWSGRDRDRDRDRDRESERESQRRREEGHGRGLTSDGLRRETGLWMVFFLGAAAVRSSSPLAIQGCYNSFSNSVRVCHGSPHAFGARYRCMECHCVHIFRITSLLNWFCWLSNYRFYRCLPRIPMRNRNLLLLYGLLLYVHMFKITLPRNRLSIYRFYRCLPRISSCIRNL